MLHSDIPCRIGQLAKQQKGQRLQLNQNRPLHGGRKVGNNEHFMYISFTESREVQSYAAMCRHVWPLTCDEIGRKVTENIGGVWIHAHKVSL